MVVETHVWWRWIMNHDEGNDVAPPKNEGEGNVTADRSYRQALQKSLENKRRRPRPPTPQSEQEEEALGDDTP
jgi:hypothetical protein